MSAVEDVALWATSTRPQDRPGLRLLRRKVAGVLVDFVILRHAQRRAAATRGSPTSRLRHAEPGGDDSRRVARLFVRGEVSVYGRVSRTHHCGDTADSVVVQASITPPGGVITHERAGVLETGGASPSPDAFAPPSSAERAAWEAAIAHYQAVRELSDADATVPGGRGDSGWGWRGSEQPQLRSSLRCFGRGASAPTRHVQFAAGCERGVCSAADVTAAARDAVEPTFFEQLASDAVVTEVEEQGSGEWTGWGGCSGASGESELTASIVPAPGSFFDLLPHEACEVEAAGWCSGAPAGAAEVVGSLVDGLAPESAASPAAAAAIEWSGWGAGSTAAASQGASFFNHIKLQDQHEWAEEVGFRGTAPPAEGDSFFAALAAQDSAAPDLVAPVQYFGWGYDAAPAAREPVPFFDASRLPQEVGVSSSELSGGASLARPATEGDTGSIFDGVVTAVPHRVDGPEEHSGWWRDSGASATEERSIIPVYDALCEQAEAAPIEFTGWGTACTSCTAAVGGAEESLFLGDEPLPAGVPASADYSGWGAAGVSFLDSVSTDCAQASGPGCSAAGTPGGAAAPPHGWIFDAFAGVNASAAHVSPSPVPPASQSADLPVHRDVRRSCAAAHSASSSEQMESDKGSLGWCGALRPVRVTHSTALSDLEASAAGGSEYGEV